MSAKPDHESTFPSIQFFVHVFTQLAVCALRTNHRPLPISSISTIRLFDFQIAQRWVQRHYDGKDEVVADIATRNLFRHGAYELKCRVLANASDHDA